MSLRWLWQDYFDPEHRPRESRERLAVVRLANAYFMRRPALGAVYLVVTLLVMATVIGTYLGFVPRPQRNHPWVLVAFVGGLLAAHYLTHSLLCHALYRSCIRRALTHLGTPVCVRCGHSRRGIVSTRACPECGGMNPPALDLPDFDPPVAADSTGATDRRDEAAS